MREGFGDVIREWRGIRRLSQLDLALAAGLSSRHLSFLESGRAAPSRSMILKISSALQMPKGAVNRAFGAAGYSAAFPSFAGNGADLAPVRRAIDMTLSNHEPLPAFAIDKGWTLIAANAAASRLFAAIGADIGASASIIEQLIRLADGASIENWEETAQLSLLRLKAEIASLGGDPLLEDYARRLQDHPRLKSADLSRIDFNQPVIPTIFRVEGARLSLFSTIAQFGTVQDVAASELRIELMFAADEASEQWFRPA